jgi:2'-5' RNA ligase
VIRAFIGVRINPDIARRITEVISQLKPRVRGVRWVPEENFHFTLKFLGRVDDEKILPIHRALVQQLKLFSRFTINAKGLGVFPGLKRPRVLWVGLEGSQLALLAAAVEEALEPIGFLPEARSFKPHLTIARWRQPERLSKAVSEEIERWKGHEFGESQVEEVIVFQSVLRPDGAIYRPLQVLTLANEASLDR